MQEYYIVLGDFSIKSEIWHKHDKMSYKGAEIDALTSQFDLLRANYQIAYSYFIAEPSSCIDLKFTSHQNLVMESGVHSSLPNCHH